MKRALILIDIQNDYFPGGCMALPGMERAADNARHLLAHFRREAQPVFHIRHVSTRPCAGFFLPGTPGAEINEVVAPEADETVIEKHFPNSFRDTALLDALETAAVDTVLVCGAMSQMCVDATARAAFDYGLMCQVADDACAARPLEHNGEKVTADAVHAAFMAALAVPYATVASAHELTAG